MNPASSSRPFAGSSDSGKSGIDPAGPGEQLRVRKQELQAVPEALREDALIPVSA